VNKRIFISAGEASGDLHAAGLISELKRIDGSYEFWGLGGDRLRSEGTETAYDITDLSTMGFAEVLKKIPFFRNVYHSIISRFEMEKPDAAILVDYPGMNFKFAKRLDRMGVPFVYYIQPQAWAWNKRRIRKMRKWNAKFISILPFEPEFFRKNGLEVEYYGHPLVDKSTPDLRRGRFRREHGVKKNDFLIAVLPGSRLQEIKSILPTALEAIKKVRDKHAQVRIICRPFDQHQNILYEQIIERIKLNVEVYNGNLHNLLNAADLTLVTSGTATVEAAISRSPAIVMYKTNQMTYLIARSLIRVKNIAMANLIAGEEVYPELIQSKLNRKRLAKEIRRFIEDDAFSRDVRVRISKVAELLGGGQAYKKAAESVNRFFFGRKRIRR